MKQFVKPDPDCKLCRGTGEVFDSVDYGSTTASLPSFCDCVEMQVADYEDIDIVLVLDDTAMRRITLDVTVGEYAHAEYHYFHGNEEQARMYAEFYLDTIWGEEHNETNYDNVDECYYDVNGEKAAQLGSVEVLEFIPAMSVKGAFHFQPIGWRIK